MIVIFFVLFEMGKGLPMKTNIITLLVFGHHLIEHHDVI